MQDKRLGIGIFGAGRWGTHLIRNFLSHPDARVIAIVDPNAKQLESLARRFTLDAQVVLTSDWKMALQIPEIAGVAIATPATTHYTLIQSALEHGHHVLAEKPLTLTWEECITLCKLAEQQHRQLVVDHTYLFHPAVEQGRAILQNGHLGNLRYGYATRTHLGPVRQDVDALWDLAIHDLCIFNHWLGELPCQVQAQGTVWLQDHIPDAIAFPQGLSDLVWIQLWYPNGFQAFIHLCWSNPDKQRRLCIVGDQGTLIFDELRNNTPLYLQKGRFQQKGHYFSPTDQSLCELIVASEEPLRKVCNHFLHCAHYNKPSPISSGWVGAQLVKILCALTKSLNQAGQIISLEDN